MELAFNTEVIPSHLCGTVLDQSPFTFQPPVDGESRWLSQTLIRFTPSEHLKPGITYRGLFKGKTAFGEQCNVNDYEFTFKTAEQEVLSFMQILFGIQVRIWSTESNWFLPSQSILSG